MKLAHANIDAVVYGRRNCIPLTSSGKADRVFSRIGLKPVRRLTARWHIPSETGTLECSWSLEAIRAEDPAQSCGRQRRGGLRRSLSHRRNHRS